MLIVIHLAGFKDLFQLDYVIVTDFLQNSDFPRDEFDALTAGLRTRTMRTLGLNNTESHKATRMSYLSVSPSTAAAAVAAETAAQRKETKYAEISKTYLFFPLAFETVGPINCAGQEFILDLGHRISYVTDDPRESGFLFQRIPVTLQRFIAVVCFTYAFEQEHDVFLNQPGDT
jgi:hypothetical protein